MISHDEQLTALADAVATNQLTFDHEAAAELPPAPKEEPKVTVSLRLEVADYQRVQAAAEAAKVKPTALMRDWILAGLAGADVDRTISVAALLRAVATIPPATERDAA